MISTTVSTSKSDVVCEDGNHVAYAAMVRIAEKLGWPTSYATDLYAIDRAFITGPCAPRRFGWVITPTGSHLVYDKDGTGTRAYIRTIASGWPVAAWYWFDGSRMSMVSQERMWELAQTLPTVAQLPHEGYHSFNARCEQYRAEYHERTSATAV